MRVSILGAGAIAFGCAAMLEKAGHEVWIWSPSGKQMLDLARGQPLVATGAFNGSYSPRVAHSIAEAIASADVILFALPGNGHKLVFDAAVPHLREGQPLIISSHLSFGALYLNKRLIARGVRSPIIAWGTTVTTGRKTGTCSVHVGTVRKEVDMAVLPTDAAELGHALCTRLFGDRFVQREGLLAISLSNLNPQNHLAIALLNLTRIERGEEWSQLENTTPLVGQFMEALDAERLAIANSFGLKVKTVREHVAMTANVPIASVAEMSLTKFREAPGVSGPKSVDTRYVLEDAPFGLLPIVLLGQLADHKATLHEAGMAILSAAYGRNFAKENDLLPELDLARLSSSALHQLLLTGF